MYLVAWAITCENIYIHTTNFVAAKNLDGFGFTMTKFVHNRQNQCKWKIFIDCIPNCDLNLMHQMFLMTFNTLNHPIWLNDGFVCSRMRFYVSVTRSSWSKKQIWMLNFIIRSFELIIHTNIFVNGKHILRILLKNISELFMNSRI